MVVQQVPRARWRTTFMLVYTLVLSSLGAPSTTATEPHDVRLYAGVQSVLAGDSAPHESDTITPTLDDPPQRVETLATPPREARSSSPSHEHRENALVATVSASTRPWVVGGFVDIAYQLSSNFPNNHVYRGMFTSPRTGEVTPNLVAAYVRHDVADQAPWSVELALHAGAAANALTDSEPTPGGEDSAFAGASVWRHVARANAGARIQASGTNFDAGLFACPIGIGTFWTLDNWNYTTPWQLNGVPYYLAGGRITQDMGKHTWLHAWVVNGWQTIADVNRVPSYIVGISGEPRTGLQWSQYVYAGPESADTRMLAWRVLSNSQLAYWSGKFGVSALFDIGHERMTERDGDPSALWLTAQAGWRQHLLGRRHTWTMATRAEVYWDRNGRIYGADQWLLSGTHTHDFDLFEHVLVRVEYRYDHSTARDGFFFRGTATAPNAEGLAQNQHTLVLAVTGRFEFRFAARAR